ncbi:putative glutamate--cysteine ligase 2 [Zafaria cholistanensis]|uniref:Putative glutamate--cysteine ligase 2 n=1 Tax=Zafaria cholistanensis TaxID=1682741 RepID=A0A5A7NTS5_9MICC|nr:glutamate--cysteine ligase [Zafaria cholistanensis]GER23218.1 putative glutamate--cysteine ligase 2 [Zafaria cholistanensis]
MRSYGVEEEFLLVDSVTLEPAPVGEAAVNAGRRTTDAGHEATLELQQEQMEVVCPPRTTLAGQLEAIQEGRALAREVAARAGAAAVALPVFPCPAMPQTVPATRPLLIRERFGVTAREQVTCGFHVHVAIGSREEGVAVLDRIRIWLPVLLALSSNSPYWNGTGTGYESYRYQLWSRWPTTGPSEVFGSVAAYDEHCRQLVASAVPVDERMLYLDARLSSHVPTVEVRVADVCLDARHAAVLATLVRALVETAARDWRGGTAPAAVGANVLRAWTWGASRSGVDGHLVDPLRGVPAPAGDVVARFLDVLRPVLGEYGEERPVEAVVGDILRTGTGARLQHEAYRQDGPVHVLRAAVDATHRQYPAP